MTRRQQAPSLDEIFEVDGPEVDPGAAQWHTWAVKASKQSVRDLTFNLFPFDNQRSSRNSASTSKKSTPPPPTASPPSPVEDTTAKVDKRPVYMTDSIRHLFSDPPLCFCRKPASRSETLEYGVLYDCHWMNHANDQTNIICGFHIHNAAWRTMGETIDSNQYVDKHHPELVTCPYFNFTFCVAFNLTNTIKTSSPRGRPQCFCQRQVILHESDDKERLCFVCPNFYKDGAKPKCSWFLWADELAFSRPKYPRHGPELLKEAQARRQRCGQQDEGNGSREGDGTARSGTTGSDSDGDSSAEQGLDDPQGV